VMALLARRELVPRPGFRSEVAHTRSH
jgi:hypothetical protein